MFVHAPSLNAPKGLCLFARAYYSEARRWYQAEKGKAGVGRGTGQPQP